MARTMSGEQSIINLEPWLSGLGDGNFELEIPGPTRLLVSKQGKNLSAPFITPDGRAQLVKVRPVEPQSGRARA